MKVRHIYPTILQQTDYYRIMRQGIGYSFLIAGILCFVINFFVKGPFWSLIVGWCLLGIWNMVFSLRLLEYSLFTHFIRLVFYIVGLLICLDFVFDIEALNIVIPIVLFGALVIFFILYYAAISKRDRNITSILSLGLVQIVSIFFVRRLSGVFLILFYVFHAATVVLLVVLILLNWKDFLFEVKTRVFENQKR